MPGFLDRSFAPPKGIEFDLAERREGDPFRLTMGIRNSAGTGLIFLIGAIVLAVFFGGMAWTFWVIMNWTVAAFVVALVGVGVAGLTLLSGWESLIMSRVRVEIDGNDVRIVYSGLKTSRSRMNRWSGLVVHVEKFEGKVEGAAFYLRFGNERFEIAHRDAAQMQSAKEFFQEVFENAAGAPVDLLRDAELEALDEAADELADELVDGLFDQRDNF